MHMSLNSVLAVAIAGATLAGAAARADIRMVDDHGRTVVLEQPARRIVSLAPHVTELLFAAGAGDRIVGAVDYSNYPEAAKDIPRVGSNRQLDLERIVSLKPDLIVVWLHGAAQRQLDKLLTLGIPVFYNEPRRLTDIARAIEQLGELAGTGRAAHEAARTFAAREAELRARYAGRAPVSVFYQIWQKPLMTVNGEHLISDVLRLCGAQNIFADLAPLVPVIATEAVLAADPEAIGTGIFDSQSRNSLDVWKAWPRLTATARNNFFYVPTDFISRHSPRILEGARQICEALDAARAKRSH